MTPVHNTAEHLAECIESVLDQTYQDFEYIIVENQSTDGSGSIADEYAARDPRIRVVRTPSLLPQVQNYNFALAQIAPASRYTKICQADDWLFPHCLADMAGLGGRHPSAGLISSYRLRGSTIDNLGLPVSTTFMRGADVCVRYFLEGLYLFGSPSTVMYRSDLVRDRSPFYEEGRLHEDTEVCFELLRTTDFCFVHQILSFSRVEEQSVMGGRRELLPSALDRIIVSKRFGPVYLDEADERRATKLALDSYYASLARRTVRGVVVSNHREFWDYQRRALQQAGERISP
ncbi:MAG: glycosyltransferase family 2 protein, partial [Ilumatobacteraceae bacterium]